MEFFLLLSDVLKIPFFLFVFLLLGKVFYGRIVENFNYDFVKKTCELFFGYLFFLIFYAIIKTSGKTVLSLFLIVVLLQYLSFRQKPDILIHKSIKIHDLFFILKFFLIFVVIWFIQLIRHKYFNDDYIFLGWGDYGHYSNIAEALNIIGIESDNNINIFFNSDLVKYSNNPTPYHYIELWTQAMFLNFLKTNGVFVFLYITIPFISTLIIFSFISLGLTLLKEHSFFKNFFLVLIALLVPFFIGKLPCFKGGWEDNVFFYPRNFMFYILFAFFVIFNESKYKIQAIYFIAFISFANILYVPTISITLLILAFYQYYFLKDKSNFKTTLILSLLVLVLHFVFYFILFPSTNTAADIDFDLLFSKANLFRGLNYYFRANLVRFWFFYLPLFLFIVYQLYEGLKNKNFVVLKNITFFLVLLLYLVSLIFASFVPHLESGTFHSIILNPSMTILSFIALISLLNEKNRFIGNLLFALILLQFFYSAYYVVFNENTTFIGNNFSKKFLKDLENRKIENKLGVFVSNTGNSKNCMYSAKANMSWFTSIFDVKDNGFFQVSLSAIIDADSIPSPLIDNQVRNTVLFKFVNSLKKNNKEITKKEIDSAFIEYYKIEYLIVEPEAEIPIFLKNKILSEITDEVTNLKVILVVRK